MAVSLGFPYYTILAYILRISIQANATVGVKQIGQVSVARLLSEGSRGILVDSAWTKAGTPHPACDEKHLAFFAGGNAPAADGVT
ncbi:MAG: hypothetical protein J2P54_10610, partial [Bradyrhizobiaceae bacterium]|nr:hypothetical protein [Bradyrhizobiaceae bacterium]